MTDCMELLRQELEDGKWHSAEEVRSVMKGYGVKRTDFKNARKELGVKTRNNGDGTWSWRLEKNE